MSLTIQLSLLTLFVVSVRSDPLLDNLASGILSIGNTAEATNTNLVDYNSNSVENNDCDNCGGSNRVQDDGLGYSGDFDPYGYPGGFGGGYNGGYGGGYNGGYGGGYGGGYNGGYGGGFGGGYGGFPGNYGYDYGFDPYSGGYGYNPYDYYQGNFGYNNYPGGYGYNPYDYVGGNGRGPISSGNIGSINNCGNGGTSVGLSVVNCE